jgi:hypothetical protein
MRRIQKMPADAVDWESLEAKNYDSSSLDNTLS